MSLAPSDNYSQQEYKVIERDQDPASGTADPSETGQQSDRLSARLRKKNEQTGDETELPDRKSMILINQSKYEVCSRTKLIEGYHSQREKENAESNDHKS